LPPDAPPDEVADWLDNITSGTLQGEMALATEALALAAATGGAGNSNVLLTISKTTPVGSVYAAVISPSGQSEDSVMLEVEGLGIELPTAVLSQLQVASGSATSGGPVVAVATKLNNATAAGFHALAGSIVVEQEQPIVSLNLLSGDYILKGVPLAEPIVLTLLTQKVAGARCAYWDEALHMWSSQGLQEVASEASFKCSTNHLTIFTAAFEEIATAWHCSNADLFSQEGLTALSTSLWFVRPAALVFLTLLLLQVAHLARAFYKDRQHQCKDAWKVSNFFTEEKAFAPVKEKGPILDRAKRAVNDRLSPENLVMKCNEKALAHQSGHCPKDLKLLVGGVVQHKHDDEGEAPGTTHLKASEPWVFRKIGGSMVSVLTAAPEASKGFWSSSLRKRVWILFVAMHPWIKLGHYSIVMTSKHRAMLLVGKALGSMAISGLFFATTSEAMSYTAPEHCEQKNVSDFVWRNIAIGMFSQFLSTIPLAMLALLQPRRFIYKEAWTEELKRTYMKRWSAADRLFEGLIFLYSAICTMFVAVFLGPQCCERAALDCYGACRCL
jgi:hypothetical protein